jgi:pectinesterase
MRHTLLSIALMFASTSVGRPVAAQDVRPPAPFTVERVLQQLQSRYPSVAPVSDALPAGVTAHESLVYDRRGGHELRLDIYRPDGAGPFAAVMLVHGGGWESGDRTMERPLARHLAARGYVTAPVTYRLGPEGRFPAALHDLKSAARWLRANAARYAIDTGRIGAVGGSAGGHLVALLGASNGVPELEGDGPHPGQSSAVQAIVDIDGAAAFPDAALIEQEERSQGATSRFLGGRYTERRTVWYAASPLTYVGRRSAPTLFVKSTAPRPILPGRDEMHARLRVLGIDSEVIVYDDTPHPFWLVHPWFERVLDDADRFLRRHLR